MEKKMADALPTHRLYFILVSWSKKNEKKKCILHILKKWLTLSLHIDCILYSFHGQKKVQKNNFTHFLKMADACLHIYFVLYSF